MTPFPSIIAALLLLTIFTLQAQADVSITTGDLITNNNGKTYSIGTELGHGKFGKVFNAVNEANEIVALKVTSTEDKFTKKTAEQEIKMLKLVKSSNSNNPGKNYCVEIKDNFVYNDQICIVLPKLGTSIGSFIKKNNWRPFQMSQIKLIAWQMVNALAFLHEIGITHGDVKPDNILFADASFNAMNIRNLHDSAIKLVDFGLSVTASDHHIRDTNMRHNRSPEMLLGWGWMEPSDVWALGCVLFELYKGGHRLFKVNHFATGVSARDLTLQHLLMVERVKGSRSNPNEPVFPDWMRIRASADSSTSDYFNSAGRVNYDESNINNFDNIYKPLDEYKVLGNDMDTDNFFSLIGEMLNVDPNNRITMLEARKHRFFREELQSQTDVPIATGNIITNNGKTYSIGIELSGGRFGKVFDAVNEDNELVALKVRSTEDEFIKGMAEREIRMLKLVKSSNSNNPGKNYCVEIKDNFVYNDQICMVLPKLGTSIGSFIKKNHWRPFQMSQIKLIAWQMVNALAFLHEIGITHGNVKTDNILFASVSFNAMNIRNLHDSAIKLVDFDFSATDNDDHVGSKNVRHNRSPEMLLGWGGLEPSDVWALGCVLFEFYTGGHRLFKMSHFATGVSSKELALQHLLMMERVKGSRSNPNEPVFPDWMRFRASANSSTSDYFNSAGRVNYDESNINNFGNIYKPLDEYKVLENDMDTDNFFSLIDEMLNVDPNNRITMLEARKHRFFVNQSMDVTLRKKMIARL